MKLQPQVADEHLAEEVDDGHAIDAILANATSEMLAFCLGSR